MKTTARVGIQRIRFTSRLFVAFREGKRLSL